MVFVVVEGGSCINSVLVISQRLQSCFYTRSPLTFFGRFLSTQTYNSKDRPPHNPLSV